MKKILLVCGAGVTSSLIAKEVNELAIGRFIVTNTNVSIAFHDYWQYQMILIAPQVKFLLPKIQQLCIQNHIKCISLSFTDYTTEKVFEIINEQIENISFENLNVTFVKDSSTGYLPRLFMNKFVKELQKKNIDCHYEIITFEQYKQIQLKKGYYIIEPKLMFFIQKDSHTVILRTQEFQSLNVDSLLQFFEEFPK